MEKILTVKHLGVSFHIENGKASVINDVSFSVGKAETVAVVGESGSGKSMTSLSILGLIPSPGKIDKGEIIFDHQDLLKLKKKNMRTIRGKDIAMIFQEPMTALNPVFKIGNQMSEVFKYHQKLSKTEIKVKIINSLKKAGIANPERVICQYPHQLSGGMRQRVMIAMALSCNPKLLIADEPTTALDVTIQAQILELLKDIKKNSDTGIILITHDLGVVAEIADKVVVMYAGEVVEEASVFDIFAQPKHPYTRALIRSIPQLDDQREFLDSIEGTVPSALNLPVGCAFNPRCPLAGDICKKSKPSLEEVNGNHYVRCFKSEELEVIGNA